ncbi:MAG: gamma carbonic anhydrase family protein [archaeon]
MEKNKKKNIQNNYLIDRLAFITKNATLIGDITIGKKTSVLYGSVLRADLNYIKIGSFSNIQDNAVIHVDHNNSVLIGNYVSVGHGAIIHGATVEDNCIIGMGAILLNGAKVCKNSIIGAGAVVTENTLIPQNSLVVGVPGKVIRNLNKEEIENIKKNALEYVKLLP